MLSQLLGLVAWFIMLTEVIRKFASERLLVSRLLGILSCQKAARAECIAAGIVRIIAILALLGLQLINKRVGANQRWRCRRASGKKPLPRESRITQS